MVYIYNMFHYTQTTPDHEMSVVSSSVSSSVSRVKATTIPLPPMVCVFADVRMYIHTMNVHLIYIRTITHIYTYITNNDVCIMIIIRYCMYPVIPQYGNMTYPVCFEYDTLIGTPGADPGFAEGTNCTAPLTATGLERFSKWNFQSNRAVIMYGIIYR